MKKLKDTIELMTSLCYKDRFRAEVFQLQIRIKSLEKMLSDWSAGTLAFQPTCSYEMLNEQLNVMKKYEQILIDRAQLEGIQL